MERLTRASEPLPPEVVGRGQAEGGRGRASIENTSSANRVRVTSVIFLD